MEPPVNGDSYEFNLNHIWSHSTSELASFLYQTSGNFTGSARVESLEKSKVALVAYPAVNIAWQDQESASAKSLFVGCQGAQGAPLLPSCKSLSIFAARPKYYGVHNAHCTAHPLKLHTWDILENGQAKRSKVSRCSFASCKLLSCKLNSPLWMLVAETLQYLPRHLSVTSSWLQRMRFTFLIIYVHLGADLHLRTWGTCWWSRCIPCSKPLDSRH